MLNLEETLRAAVIVNNFDERLRLSITQLNFTILILKK